MGIDLEKQQSPVAKDDTLAEPNKGAALPERQGDAQEKGAGKMLEEKHSPSDDEVLLGVCLEWIGLTIVVIGLFCLPIIFERKPSWGVVLLGVVIHIVGSYLKLSMRKKTMDIDLEKQQSTVAKYDTLAKPSKNGVLPKRQDDMQKKGAGKMLEEKHSPSYKVPPAVTALGWILALIGTGVVHFAYFVDMWEGMVIGVVFIGIGLSLLKSGKSDGGGDVDFDFDCDGGGDGD